jgi:multimeric flavodoxin WrbA
MKILVLTGSFRKKGNTNQIIDLLVRELTDSAAREGTQVENQTIHLAESRLTYCHGCRVCFDRGETSCPYWDEIAPIKAAMQAADVWILASPVYVDDVNGLMKTFLDRMAHGNHRPEFAGKYAYLVTTSGTGSSGHAARTLVNTLRTWGTYIIGSRDFVAGALSSPEEMNSRYKKSISGIADKIMSAFRNNKAHSPSMVSLIFFKVQQTLWNRKVEDSIDYHYWESKGWLQPGVTYYIPHCANPLTVFFGRLAGGIIALFFK